MAKRRENCPSMVLWEMMRLTWTNHARDQEPQSFDYVRSFFNTFISKHRGYQFIVAQKYTALYDIGITWEQYDQVKIELERGRSGLQLPDINVMEYLTDGERMIKSFSNLSEFRAYKDNFVRQRNRDIVRRKHQEANQHYQKVQSYYAGSTEMCIVSFDLEAYEFNHDKVLEIGYIVVYVGSADPRFAEKRHFIIEENLHYDNGAHVSSNRNGFSRFGESQTVSLQDAIKSFRQAVASSTFLVAHSAHSDEGYLKRIGVDISQLRKEIMDTQQIELHLESTRPGQRPHDDRLYLRGLKRLLEDYQIEFDPEALHNAGCDAYYTMKLFLRQMGCSGATVNALK